MAEKTIITDVNETIAEAKLVAKVVRETAEKVYSLGVAVKNVLVQMNLSQYMTEAAKYSESLSKSLLVLRLSFGRLKSEIAQAAAPLASVFVPLVNQAIWAAIRLTRSVGKVMRALLGGTGASADFGTEVKEAAKAQNSLAKANAKVKRSLAGFDEITRLQDPASGVVSSSSSSAVVLPKDVEDTLSPRLQAIVDKIKTLIEPLKKIDLTPAAEAFGRFKEALAPLCRTLFAGLEWAWYNLFVPLAAWTVEDILPLFLDLLAEGLKALNTAIVALKPFAIWLWENFLKPLAQWAGGKVVETLTGMTGKLGDLSTWITDNQDKVWDLIDLVQKLADAWNRVSSTIDRIKEIWAQVKGVWSGVASWFQTTVLNPVQNGFKKMANGIIGLLNGVLSGLGRGINRMIGALNTLHFELPKWIPGIGGQKFGFNLKTVSIPQIPYLAKGAVLPANKPFMAVVGDQKHGTNVEAPLATIQEAVALVMGEQTAALVAGFESSIGVQREILQAVLGISIGDDVIGQAVARYNRKMAVVRGG
ncbi:MAG: hypothetical protein IJW41_01875 [Oscillospiraceae bacterium]|nr:hypothetical protein [Oscillospiraceae bacterium]